MDYNVVDYLYDSFSVLFDGVFVKFLCGIKGYMKGFEFLIMVVVYGVSC